MKLKICNDLEKARFHFMDSVTVSDGKTINITVSVKSEDKDSRQRAVDAADIIINALKRMH